MDSHLFAGRRIDGSFALVEVPGQQGVMVYADNQPVARTDRDGFALVPRLRAYQHNPIRIDMKGLPIDAVADVLEKSAVPAARSGLKLKFPIRSTRSAMMHLVRDDGTPVPPGAEVRTAGQSEPAFVALEGRFYLTDPSDGQVLEVRWATGTCNARLPIVDQDAPMPELGTVRCSGVSP
jgi:outer membrane usher protein